MPVAAVFFRHQATGSAMLQQHCSLLEGKLLSLQRKADHQALGSKEVEVRMSALSEKTFAVEKRP